MHDAEVGAGVEAWDWGNTKAPKGGSVKGTRISYKYNVPLNIHFKTTIILGSKKYGP